MKQFDQHELLLDQCLDEVATFQKLLAKHPILTESQIRAFFQEHRQLSALCGRFVEELIRCDRVAWEYDLFGDFSCDLAVGDSVRKAYCFLEFEDAGPKSLFVREGKKNTRAWSPRFEHGYSQIVDWFYKLRDQEKSDEYEARFGSRSVDYSGVLLIGRNRYLDARERMRLDWRKRHTLVDSRRIHCLTYDDLLSHLRYLLGEQALGAEDDSAA